MDLSAHVLGAGIARQLATRHATPVLRLGRDTFTRGDLAGVACFNFQAAATLSRIVATIDGVTSTRDVFDRVPPSALAIPHIGAIAIAVLGAAFERKGIGGDHPLEAWITKHRKTATRPIVTFDTLKHQYGKDSDGNPSQIRNERKRKRQRKT